VQIILVTSDPPTKRPILLISSASKGVDILITDYYKSMKIVFQVLKTMCCIAFSDRHLKDNSLYNSLGIAFQKQSLVEIVHIFTDH